MVQDIETYYLISCRHFLESSGYVYLFDYLLMLYSEITMFHNRHIPQQPAHMSRFSIKSPYNNHVG